MDDGVGRVARFNAAGVAIRDVDVDTVAAGGGHVGPPFAADAAAGDGPGVPGVVVEAAQVGRNQPVAAAVAAGEGGGVLVGVEEGIDQADAVGDLVAQPGDEQVGLVAGADGRAVDVAVAHQARQPPGDVG